jgi:hypothetical protein
MDKKYGVYICEGCGLGESLDIEKLCDVPKEEGLAVKTCPILCGKEGVELLDSVRQGRGRTSQKRYCRGRDQYPGDCSLFAPGAL